MYVFNYFNNIELYIMNSKLLNIKCNNVVIILVYYNKNAFAILIYYTDYKLQYKFKATSNDQQSLYNIYFVYDLLLFLMLSLKLVITLQILNSCAINSLNPSERIKSIKNILNRSFLEKAFFSRYHQLFRKLFGNMLGQLSVEKS